MISTSPSLSCPKTQQLDHFLATPTPQSLLEPTPKRSRDQQPVYATRRADGRFQLYALTSIAPIGHSRPRGGDLGEFLDELASEIRAQKGKQADNAVREMRLTLRPCDWRTHPPTVRDLRRLNARMKQALDDMPDASTEETSFRQRARSTVAINTLQDALNQGLRTLSQGDPRREALRQAGQLLLDGLIQPDATLSLKGLAVDSIHWLHGSGLLTRFAHLRDGMDPPLERLIAPEAAQHLLDPLRLPTIRTLMLV